MRAGYADAEALQRRSKIAVNPADQHNRPSREAVTQMLQALKHAYQRLNEIRHNYADTDFKLLREAIAKAESNK